MTGLHLKFDAAFLRQITEHLFDGHLQIGREAPPKTIGELMQNKRDERRRACQYAVEDFGSGRNSDLETLVNWKSRCDEMGYPKRAKPIVIIVDVGPEAKSDWMRDLPREYKSYPIRYRESPVAETQYGSGSRVGNGDPDFGTLGGILQDNVTHQLFGVTCSHVAGASGTAVGEVDNNGIILKSIGQVVANTLPPTGGPCNKHARPAAGIDAALIELTATASAQLSSSMTVGPIADIDQDDLIVFEGSKSGSVAARVAAATIWKKIKIAGEELCFGDLFSIGNRQPIYVLQSVSQGGDSGAWIFEDAGSRSASTRWLGMLIAGDKQHNQSLACFAEHIFQWARSEKSDLVLPP